MRKRILKGLTFLGMAAIATVLYVMPAKAATGVNVEYHTQEEIIAFIKQSGAALDDKLTFKEQPQTEKPYALGSLSNKTLKSALAMINQIRYVAGLSYDVQLSDEYNELTQAAALSNYANRTLSHFPEQPAGMSDSMYELAYTGASSSNIAWASWQKRSMNETIMYGWMNDGDDYNIEKVGHRRWVLNPSMTATGFGAVSGTYGTYSAMYAFDRAGNAEEYGVMWPAQNMPIEYFDTSFPWTISMGTYVDISTVQVKLTRASDGKVWKFSQASANGYFNVDNGGYGQIGCIIFRPNKGITSYEDGDSYTVSITGLPDGDVEYTVNFFTLKERVSDAKVTLKTNRYAYDGKKKTPKVVSVVLGDTVLTEGTDYTVSYKNNKNIGTAKVVITGIGNYAGTVTKTFTIYGKEGTTFTVGAGKYKISGEAEVAYAGPKSKSAKKAVIPKSVEIGGKKFAVTSIAAKAFKGCGKINTITIKSAKITSVAKNAFKGLKKTVKVKVPKAQLKQYKKLLKGKVKAKNIK